MNLKMSLKIRRQLSWRTLPDLATKRILTIINFIGILLLGSHELKGALSVPTPWMLVEAMEIVRCSVIECANVLAFIDFIDFSSLLKRFTALLSVKLSAVSELAWRLAHSW